MLGFSISILFFADFIGSVLFWRK